ncbi:MAG: hypothetical protein HOQ01_11095 [Lysobacter sp.]|nr:hypothetical protein [Lysobacter sp.]
MTLLPLARRLSRGALLALAMLALALPMAHATKLKKQNLIDLISQSDSIIAGTVKQVSDGIDDKGVPYTEITIAVGASAKGKIRTQQDYTFRQFGLLEPRAYPNGHKLLAMTPEAFPTWRKGEYVVAFLFRPASRTGLQTTVGLAQGKFSLANGRMVNEFNNAGLFEGVDIDPKLLTRDEQAMLRSAGPVDTRTFMDLVGRAIEKRWIEKGEMK